MLEQEKAFYLYLVSAKLYIASFSVQLVPIAKGSRYQDHMLLAEFQILAPIQPERQPPHEMIRP